MRFLCFASLALLPLTACDSFTQSCTEIGCLDGLKVTVKSSGSAFEPGEYRFTFTEKGVSRVVGCTVGPLPSRGSVCAGTEVIPVLGAAGISDFQIRLGVVERITITLTTVCETAPLLSAELTPKYQSFSPNGESCGPTCTSASETLTAMGAALVICDDAGVRD